MVATHIIYLLLLIIFIFGMLVMKDQHLIDLILSKNSPEAKEPILATPPRCPAIPAANFYMNFTIMDSMLQPSVVDIASSCRIC
jgi:hypothetical protein